MEKYLLEKLRPLAQTGKIKNIRGKGLLIAFDVDPKNSSELVSAALKRGLLLNAPNPRVIRLMPPLIVGKKEIDQMVKIFSGLLEPDRNSNEKTGWRIGNAE